MTQKPAPDGAEMGERLARGVRERHHPSREGSAGGANREVSWLRASGSPSRLPSGVEPLRHARHSGGGAPAPPPPPRFPPPFLRRDHSTPLPPPPPPTGPGPPPPPSPNPPPPPPP